MPQRHQKEFSFFIFLANWNQQSVLERSAMYSEFISNLWSGLTGKVTKTRIILSFFSLPKTLRNRNKFDTNNDNNDNNMADTKHGPPRHVLLRYKFDDNNHDKAFILA